MPKRAMQIEMLLKAIRKMKLIIAATDANIELPYAIKTQKLELQRQNLFSTILKLVELADEEFLDSEDIAA